MNIPELIAYQKDLAKTYEEQAKEHRHHGRFYNAVESEGIGKAFAISAQQITEAWANEQKQGKLL